MELSIELWRAVTVVRGTVRATASHSDRSGSARRARTTARTTEVMLKQLSIMVAVFASEVVD
jgi:hypothetical protein